MIAYLFLGVALLIGFILLSRWFVNADVKQVAAALRIVAVVLGALFLAYLLISGRWSLLPALLFVGLPWINRFRNLRRALGGFRARPSAGQASGLETRFLRMHLDHDSGEMDGEVRDGAFAGRSLAEMSLDDLVALLDECFREDAQSARVLESYLDRVHGADWRARARQAGPTAPMSRDEAYQILGLEPGAGEREIKDAYHRLIGRMHPDQGGSTYLAAKLNQARDTLLGA